MKIFVLGLPHTQTTTEFTTCAFTMKAYHLCKMMHRRGHEVIHVGVEGSNPECSENVACADESDWRKLYGHPGTSFYNLDTTSPGHKEYHERFAERMRAEIMKRCREPQEAIICVPWGGAQQVAVEHLPQIVVESGIGYPVTWAKYRVFESYAWLHMHLGKEGKWGGNCWYDVVIPNAFDPDHFEFRATKDNYFLYIGRLGQDKGVKIAVDAARAAGVPIKIVGQGDPSPYLGECVEYLPPVGVKERSRLMAGARAVFVPTQYVEPFGGVNVEAQMCGTPVITTDWGVFPETVIHGVTGYRCRTWEHFAWAAKNVHNLDPQACRDWAIQNYSLDRVALMYDEYFQSLLNMVKPPSWQARNHGRPADTFGWYQENANRTQLDWLAKVYPHAATKEIDLTQPLESPPDDSRPQTWEEAQHFESDWWGLEWSPRWDAEISKQATYANLMGIPDGLDMGKPTSVLDVGCGPVSMLLRANVHGGRAVGVDPLPISDETRARYVKAGVLFVNAKAETLFAGTFPETFDEVWLYNCLQHTDDPAGILKAIASLGKRVRIFEWLNTPPTAGHPHTLTERLFADAFASWTRQVWTCGTLAKHDLYGDYIAAVVDRKEAEVT